MRTRVRTFEPPSEREYCECLTINRPKNSPASCELTALGLETIRASRDRVNNNAGIPRASGNADPQEKRRIGDKWNGIPCSRSTEIIERSSLTVPCALSQIYSTRPRRAVNHLYIRVNSLSRGIFYRSIILTETTHARARGCTGQPRLRVSLEEF